MTTINPDDHPTPESTASESGVSSATEETSTSDFGRLVDAAPFALVAIDSSQRLAQANASGRRILGLAASEVVGRAFVDLLAEPGDSPLIDEALRTAANGEVVQRSIQIRAAGVLRCIDVRFWRHGGSTDDRIVLAMLDPSAAQDQARQISSLIARSPQGMARIVDGTSLSAVNQRWAEITGQPVSEAAGAGWHEYIDIDGRSDFLAALQEALEQTRGLQGKLRINTSQGEERWLEVSVSPLDQADQGLLTFEDVTEDLDNARRADELSRALEATTDLVGILSSDGQVLRWMNDSLSHLLSEDALSEDFVDSLNEASQIAFSDALETVESDGSWRGELDLRTAAGDLLAVSAMLVPHRDVEGAVDAISLVARDITELRSAQNQVVDIEQRMAALVENAAELSILVGRDAKVIYATPAVERLLEHSEGGLQGSDILELVHPDDLQAAYDLAADVLVDSANDEHDHLDENTIVIAEAAPSTAILRVAHHEGSYRTLEVTAKDFTNNPAVDGIVINATDITERLAQAEQLESMSFHDELTGLANRALLIEKLPEALRRARERRTLVGLLSLDLDRFKVVNESLGHQAGDEMLNEVAGRIENVVRPGDIVARLGGDEFVIAITDMLRPGDAVNAARRLRKSLTRPIRVAGESVVITASIGIAIAEGDETPEDLLRDADTALHRAKNKGRDLAVVFDDHLRDQAVRRLEVENMLRQAIEDDALVVHYQPVLDVKTGRIEGSEALVRIQASDGSLVMPGSFIDVAEDSGLISQLGHQVLVKSICQTAEWTRHTRPGQPRLSIAVNVSARQLTDPNYTDKLRHELENAALAPSQLSLELTESALIDGNPTIERSLQELRSLGVRIGLDDFGTGFSSLAYLKRFPISFLKIDRSFVDGLGTDENDSAIVRATIALAHGLNLRVVAEGVETEDQLEQLAALDCDLVQGYLFSKPVGPEEFVNFLGMRWSS